MLERKKAQDAAILVQLRSLQKRMEESALIDAQTRAAARAAEVEHALCAVNEALELWSSAALDGDVLNPDRLALISADVHRRDQDLATAQDLQRREDEAAARQEARVAESASRLEQSEEIAKGWNRRLARRLEERRQTKLEERTTYAWCAND